MKKYWYEYINSIDREDSKYQLALQCSPVLTGIKISNLLIIPNSQVSVVCSTFRNTQISTSIFLRSNDKTTMLVYNKKFVEGYIRELKVSQFLKSFGYENLNLCSILVELRLRYTNYKETGTNFPHELGVLLGYPICDVISFIENQGKNSLYTGYWKVYHNVEETKGIFLMYNKSREYVIKRLASGTSIQNILIIPYLSAII